VVCSWIFSFDFKWIFVDISLTKQKKPYLSGKLRLNGSEVHPEEIK